MNKVTPPCPYFGTCGGCTMQDVAYPDQLILKRGRLQRLLGPLGTVPEIEIVPLDEPWRYRNKAELTFGESEGQILLGYHAAGSFWRIVDVEDCLLLPQPVMAMLRDTRRLIAATGLPVYRPRTHQGFFRYLIVRHSQATDQVLLCLLTAPGPRDVVERLAHDLMARHPRLSSFYWGITGKLADIAVPDELHLIEGTAYLDDRVGPFQLKLHPLSFLQPARLQAERLYEALCEGLGGGSPSVAWDLYCGLGLVAFYLSRCAQKVYGIDSEPRSLDLAVLNASLNGVRNVEFRAGRVETILLNRRFWLQEAKPDVMVVDPPRAGLHPRAVPSILAARPHRLAYVSCNPQALVRDLGSLLAGFPRYRLTRVTAFDMFPQTDHVETLALLERA
ncbi:MAG: 23S rRNA (uracil(1939)-C(5))-methyltransferase RlmD [Candidatus Omnitrophica bacterium]|nr:23S rRNA (uracil(1939)-C(5))-methyltransferase RlmD [Candidatus Omnitrophota bacterium]